MYWRVILILQTQVIFDYNYVFTNERFLFLDLSVDMIFFP